MFYVCTTKLVKKNTPWVSLVVC